MAGNHAGWGLVLIVLLGTGLIEGRKWYGKVQQQRADAEAAKVADIEPGVASALDALLASNLKRIRKVEGGARVRVVHCELHNMCEIVTKFIPTGAKFELDCGYGAEAEFWVDNEEIKLDLLGDADDTEARWPKNPPPANSPAAEKLFSSLCADARMGLTDVGFVEGDPWQ